MGSFPEGLADQCELFRHPLACTSYRRLAKPPTVPPFHFGWAHHKRSDFINNKLNITVQVIAFLGTGVPSYLGACL